MMEADIIMIIIAMMMVLFIIGGINSGTVPAEPQQEEGQQIHFQYNGTDIEIIEPEEVKQLPTIPQPEPTKIYISN